MKLIAETFDHRLALELAEGFEPAENIYPRYGLDKAQWSELRRTKEFRQLVEFYLAGLQKDGSSFRNKAGMLAESLLYVAHSVASNVENGNDARMEALKWLSKVSGKDESGNKNPPSDTPPFMININLGENKSQSMTFLPPKTVENADD